MVNNTNDNSTTSKSSGGRRGRPKSSKNVKSSKESLTGLKEKYIKEVEPSLVTKLKEVGLYEVFCDSLVALAFKNFTLEECYKLLKLKYKFILSDTDLNKFLELVFKDSSLRNSYFSYSSESIQGFLIKQLKTDSKSNSSVAIELLKISYTHDIPNVLGEQVESAEFSKQTTSTLEKILEGLEELES